jgi:folate-binding protein YgfZ
MFPLSKLSIIEFTGSDAVQFLQNQLSADIAAIPPGGNGFACCCNPAGRVLGLMLLIVRDNSVFALCASDLSEPLRDWLSRFIIRADVKISLRPDLSVAVSSSGQAHDHNGFSFNIEGQDYYILPAGDLDAGSGEYQNHEAAWHSVWMKSGVIWLGSKTTAQFLPQMLGYESIGALSFRKGCYPGQEIIARTRYLGNLKRRPLLVRIKADASVEVMDKITIHVADTDFSAVVVDCNRDDDGLLLFTVVRAAEEIAGDALTIDDTRYRIQAV